MEVKPVGTGLTSNAIRSGQDRSERRDEPLVLGVGAERDADEAGAAKRGARAHQHAALAQRGDGRAVVLVGEADPDEVGVALGDPEAALAQRPR